MHRPRRFQWRTQIADLENRERSLPLERIFQHQVAAGDGKRQSRRRLGLDQLLQFVVAAGLRGSPSNASQRDRAREHNPSISVKELKGTPTI